MKWLSILFICFQFALIAQPSNPVAPPTAPGPNLLPIVLVNNTTLPDDQVHIVILGRNPANPVPQGILEFQQNSSGQLTGVTELLQVPTTGNTSTYSVTLSQLPSAPNTTNGRYFYVPSIQSGIIFFSLAFSNGAFNQPLNMPINGGAVQQPNFTSTLDPNYNTVFDVFELTFLPGTSGTNISANATAVSFFSIPLYGFLFGANTENANTGLFLPRNSILAFAQNMFAASPEAAQWNQLILSPTATADPNGPSILRILSTGKAMTAPNPAMNTEAIFDPNYLDNQATYGYSYISDIWTGPNSFYKTNSLTMTIPAGSGQTYTGTVQNDNTLLLNSSNYQVQFAAPTMLSIPPNVPGTITTTAAIFSGINFTVLQDTSPNMEDSGQLSKLLQEAIIAGLVPTTNTLSNSYLTDNQTSYYSVNLNLSSLGQTTGPWYDLYSQALHEVQSSAQGAIYTFAFDEPLWPQVQIGANVFTNQYLGITIGPLEQAQSSTTHVNVIQVGQSVICTAFVAGASSVIPTGTVTFSLDGVNVGVISLVNGQAVFQFFNLTPGTHQITASYSGDENYLPSSDTMTIFVEGNTNPQVQVAPPINLRVTQVKNRFATQAERVNIINWEAPTRGNPPVAYKIYRNAQLTDLIATVKSGSLRFEDHSRKKERSYSYFIISIDAAGQASLPAKIVFQS